MKTLAALFACSLLMAAEGDPAAREALKGTRSVTGWKADFPGFAADLEVFHGGKKHPGKVAFGTGPDFKVQVSGIEDKTAHEYAQGALSSMAVHNASRDFDKGDGRYAITFGEDDQSPLGRIVKINGDPYKSWYRVRGKELTQVNRWMGKQHFTIDMLSVVRDNENRRLMQTFIMNTWDNETNAWVKGEAFRDASAIVSGFSLPQQRYVIVTEPGKASFVNSVTLMNHKLGAAPLVSSR